VIYRAPKIAAASGILVSATTATIHVPEGLTVRYTLDGSDPTGRSPIYKQAIRVDHGSVLKAASFNGDQRVSTIVEQRFEKVAPWPAKQVANAAPGLHCQELKGDFNQVPDWSKSIGPGHEFVATEISAPATEYLARRYSGFISIPTDEVYTFALTSDDGSKLWIDGKLVVDNDGLHSSQTKTGVAPLGKGHHEIVIEWFNKTGGSDLSVKWGAVGQKLEPLAGSAMSHTRG